MGENYDDIKELFQKSDRNIVISTAKKQETQDKIAEQKYAKRQIAFTASNKMQVLKMQVCYMDKTILLVHLAACLGTVLLGRYRHWGQVSAIAASALGALSLFEVSNLFFSGMAELGESCYFNVQQLAAFQMVYSGLLSLAALFITTIYAGVNYQLSFMETGIYILVPFVFTECICMTVMLAEIGRRNLLFLASAGVFSVLFWCVLSMYSELYEGSAFALWIAALAAGIVIFTIQVRRFFRALDRGEILCAD